MFNFIAKILNKNSKTAALIVCDIPAHKGFQVCFSVGQMKMTEVFPTLKAAQVYLINRRSISIAFAKAVGRKNLGNRRYTIRNLETGKFAPYNWQLTRADIAA